MKRWLFIWAIALISFLLPVYGDNENALVALKDYQIIRTPHFNVYFCLSSLEFQARKAGRVLEGAYAEFLMKLNFTPPQQKISVFLYESKGSFQRTAIRPTFGKASRFGFSEPIKKRIVLWLSPSERNNVYQLRLNLAQMLIFHQLFPENDLKLFFRFVYSEWMLAGLALYLAGNYDPFDKVAFETALFSNSLRSLVELKSMSHLNPGEQRASTQYMIEVFRILEKRFGVEKLRKVLEEMPLSFADSVLQKVYNLDEYQLHELVVNDLKKELGESYKNKVKPNLWAEQLTQHHTYYNHQDFGPTVSPDGKNLIFMSDREDFLNLYQMPAHGGDFSRVISLGYGWNIDDLDGLDFPPVYSPDGKHILVKGQSSFRTHLFMVGVDSWSANTPLEELIFNDYAGACFAPDGKSIVFVGIRNGVPELYRYYLGSQKIQQLSNDGRIKMQPTFSPDGTRIAYVGESDLQKDIFILNLTNKKLTHLERKGSDEFYPQFSPYEEIYFSTAHDHSIDLGRVNLIDSRWERLSSVPGAILTPALSPDGKTVYFSYHYAGRSYLFRAYTDNLKTTEIASSNIHYEPSMASEEKSRDWEMGAYESDTSTDYLFPYLAINALRVSDTAGSHQFNTSFGILSGAVIDSGGPGGGSGLSLAMGGSAGFSYTYGNFLNISMYASGDYTTEEEDRNKNGVIEEDEKGGKSFDYIIGGVISTGFELTPRISFDFGYTMFYQKKSNGFREDYKFSDDHYFLTGGFFIGVGFNNVVKRGLDPTGGYAASIKLSLFERVFGSDNSYQLVELSFRHYWSVYEDHVLMFHVSADLASGDTPTGYDLGGKSNIRGLSGGLHKGLERWVGTLEYRFPIYRDINWYCFGLLKDIRAFLFVDVGSTSTEIITKASDWDTLDVVCGVGFGIRLDYYFLEHFPMPLTLQVARRVDETDALIYYLSASKSF